jgi:hypothetical protein
MSRWLFAHVIVALGFGVLSIGASSQDFDKSFLNSTVLVKYQIDGDHQSTGTGFLLFRPISSGGPQVSYKIVLITNKHVLPQEHAAKDITVRLVVRDEAGQTRVGDATVHVLGADGKYLPSVALRPDPSIDVVAVDVTPDLIREHADILHQVTQSHSAVTTDLLLVRLGLHEASIGIGTQIYLLGYPSGIYDEENVSPILRVGIISTEPDRDFFFNWELRDRYNGLPAKVPGFLIDANVFPGSSGSMVIRRTNITPGFSPGGKAAVPYVLGIVSMSIPIDDLGGTQRMGLGVVYDADCIKETIDLLVGRNQ